MTASVIIDGLSKRFGEVTALDDLSISIDAGSVLSVLGPSGCGKSTLLRVVAGLETPDRGRVTIGDQVVVDDAWSLPPEKRPLNLVFQDYALWPHLRVAQNVGYGLHRLSKSQRADRVDELLVLFRISELADRFPAQLSGGQQQRVAIARALATQPQLLLFDEPLSNLDVQLRTDMRQELAELLTQIGTTALYVTHDPVEACALADQVLVLRDGQEEQRGTPHELFSAPTSPWVAALAGFDTRVPGIGADTVQDGLQRVHVGDQVVVARTNLGGRQPLPGQAVTLMLHPDAISLADQTPVADGVNTLVGRVGRCTYEGRSWRLTLRVRDDLLLSVVTPSAVPVGREVDIRFAIDDTLGFADGPERAAAVTVTAA
jgi:putative spermidine/putrescine transport system ATP-binding protein